MCYRLYYSNDCGHNFGPDHSLWVPCGSAHFHNRCYSVHTERRSRCPACQASYDRELDWQRQRRDHEIARQEHIRRQEEDAHKRAARHRRQLELESEWDREYERERELERERLCQRLRPLGHRKLGDGQPSDRDEEDVHVRVRWMRHRDYDYSRGRVYVRV